MKPGQPADFGKVPIPDFRLAEADESLSAHGEWPTQDNKETVMALYLGRMFMS